MSNKAKAVQISPTSDKDLSASTLAEDSDETNEVVGVRLEKRGKFSLITLSEVTGSENELIFPKGTPVAQMCKITRAKMRFMSKEIDELLMIVFIINVFVFSSFSLIGLTLLLAGFPMSSSAETLIALLSTFSVSSIVFLTFNSVRKKLRKLSKGGSSDPLKEVEHYEVKQGFNSLISGDAFEMKSPSRESLVEAVKLLNKAHEIKESLSSMKQSSNGEKTVNEELLAAQEYVTKGNDYMVELRKIEDRISEILLREER